MSRIEGCRASEHSIPIDLCLEPTLVAAKKITAHVTYEVTNISPHLIVSIVRCPTYFVDGNVVGCIL